MGYVVVTAGFEVGALFLGQRGGIAAERSLLERRRPSVRIGAAPFHLTGGTAPGDLVNLPDRVAGAIEPDRLVAGAGGAIRTLTVDSGQFFDLIVGQTKPA